MLTLSLSQTVNPYHAPAGRELDLHIHCHILKRDADEQCPRYSTDSKQADELKRRVEEDFHIKIVTGTTGIRGKQWFARYEIDKGNPTEALAETYPLAICRLVMLRTSRV
jgi:hypothetical protein